MRPLLKIIGRIIIVLCLFVTHNTVAQKWNLEQCVAFAFEQNLQLKQGYLNQDLKEEALQFQKNMRKPLLSANANNGLSSGFQQVFSGDFVGEYKAVQSYANQMGLNASVDIWNKQAQKIKINSEKINVALVTLSIEAQKLKLQLEITTKYFAVLIAKERLNVAKQVFENRKLQYEKEEKLYAIGNIALNRLTELKAYLIQDKQTQQSEQINADRAHLELAQLLQLTSPKTLDILDYPEEDLFLIYDVNELVEKAISKNPKLKMEHTKSAFYKNEISYYKTLFYPKITLNYRAGSSSQYIFDYLNQPIADQLRNNFNQNIILGLQIPLFNQGNNKVKVQQAKINQYLQENIVEQENLVLRNAVETIHFDLIAAKSLYTIAKETEEQAKIVYDFALKSYEIGKINAYELNASRDSHVVAQLKKIQAKYEIVFNQIMLKNYSH